MSEVISNDVMKEMNIDAILDLSVDQVEELQERQLFPTAQYQLLCTEATVEAGTESSGAYISVKHEVVATVELQNAEDADVQPEDGTVYSERYYAGYGIKNFRTVYADILDSLPNGEQSTVREMLEALPGTSWESLIEHRSRKDKNTDEVKTFNQMNPHYTTMIGETS